MFDIFPKRAVDFIRTNKVTKAGLYRFVRPMAEDAVLQFKDFLTKNDKILDIGTGTGNIAEVLIEQGHDLTGVDVKNTCIINNYEPILYDGKRLPFDDNAFDVSLLITVLHHTPNPEKIIKEALRVSKKVVIIEDVYDNSIDKYHTFFWDSVINLQFFNHPRTNKTHKEWQELFSRLNLQVLHAETRRKKKIGLKHATYVVQKIGTDRKFEE